MLPDLAVVTLDRKRRNFIFCPVSDGDAFDCLVIDRTYHLRAFQACTAICTSRMSIRCFQVLAEYHYFILKRCWLIPRLHTFASVLLVLEDPTVSYKPLLLLVAFLISPVASTFVDELSFDQDSLPGEQTVAGKMLENRMMALDLISHGESVGSPESILVGVQILHQNPVVPAKKTPSLVADEDVAELKSLIDSAVALRPDDKILGELAARVRAELDEKSRGLAGGPKRWTVTIKKGEHFLLDPRLVYDVQQEAIVSARVIRDTAGTGDGRQSNSTVGITVARDGSAKEFYTRSVARNKTQVRWNSGPYKAGWYVKIHHLSGPDEARVVIETN